MFSRFRFIPVGALLLAQISSPAYALDVSATQGGDRHSYPLAFRFLGIYHQVVAGYSHYSSTALWTSRSKEMNNSNLVIETLRGAANGLLMSSESDYPFEPFVWSGQTEALTNEKLRQLTNHPDDSPVEIVDLDDLFRNVAQEKEWHDETQKENVSKFKSLVSTLKANLSDVKVYRVGTIDIDVYIVGKTKEGDLAGLATKVIET